MQSHSGSPCLSVVYVYSLPVSRGRCGVGGTLSMASPAGETEEPLLYGSVGKALGKLEQSVVVTPLAVNVNVTMRRRIAGRQMGSRRVNV
jgi:hypothetical protein